MKFNCLSFFNDCQGSNSIRPFLYQTNQHITRLGLMHHHRLIHSKLICHGSWHCRECGKTSFMVNKVLQYVLLLTFFIKPHIDRLILLLLLLRGQNSSNYVKSDSSKVSKYFLDLWMKCFWLQSVMLWWCFELVSKRWR